MSMGSVARAHAHARGHRADSQSLSKDTVFAALTHSMEKPSGPTRNQRSVSWASAKSGHHRAIQHRMLYAVPSGKQLGWGTPSNPGTLRIFVVRRLDPELRLSKGVSRVRQDALSDDHRLPPGDLTHGVSRSYKAEAWPCLEHPSNFATHTHTHIITHMCWRQHTSPTSCLRTSPLLTIRTSTLPSRFTQSRAMLLLAHESRRGRGGGKCPQFRTHWKVETIPHIPSPICDSCAGLGI